MYKPIYNWAKKFTTQEDNSILDYLHQNSITEYNFNCNYVGIGK